MNEPVLCDVEWSCDMRVVWLQNRAAMELKLRVWTRSVSDSRLRLNFKMQQCGKNGKWIVFIKHLSSLSTTQSAFTTQIHTLRAVDFSTKSQPAHQELKDIHTQRTLRHVDQRSRGSNHQPTQPTEPQPPCVT